MKMDEELRKKLQEEQDRRLAEVMKDAQPDDIIESFDTFPASYVNRSKIDREKQNKYKCQ